jgi:hypothetical protein
MAEAAYGNATGSEAEAQACRQRLLSDEQHVQTPRRQPPEHNQDTNRAEANQSNQPSADLQLSLLARSLSSSRSRTSADFSAGDSFFDDGPLPPMSRFRLRLYPYMRQAPLSIPRLAGGTRPAP